MNVPCTARAYASAAEMRASYRTTRSRLKSAPVQPAAPPAPAHEPSPHEIAEVQNVPLPDNAPPVVVQPRAPALPGDLAAIVDAVGAETGLTRDQLMSDIVDERAIAARKIAAALAIRCLPLGRQAAACAFGIPEPTVRAALRRVGCVLNARAIPASADLAATVRLVVADWRLDQPPRPSIADIKRAVCAVFGVTRGDLELAQRHHPLVAVRQLAMAMAKRLAARSFPEIGRHFGGRDHTTVIHAVRKMEPLIAAAAQSVDATAGIEDWVRAARAAMEAKR